MTLAMFAFFVTVPAYVAYVFFGGVDRSDKRILILALGSSGVTGNGVFFGTN